MSVSYPILFLYVPCPLPVEVSVDFLLVDMSAIQIRKFGKCPARLDRIKLNKSCQVGLKLSVSSAWYAETETPLMGGRVRLRFALVKILCIGFLILLVKLSLF